MIVSERASLLFAQKQCTPGWGRVILASGQVSWERLNGSKEPSRVIRSVTRTEWANTKWKCQLIICKCMNEITKNSLLPIGHELKFSFSTPQDLLGTLYRLWRHDRPVADLKLELIPKLYTLLSGASVDAVKTSDWPRCGLLKSGESSGRRFNCTTGLPTLDCYLVIKIKLSFSINLQPASIKSSWNVSCRQPLIIPTLIDTSGLWLNNKLARWFASFEPGDKAAWSVRPGSDEKVRWDSTLWKKILLYGLENFLKSSITAECHPHAPLTCPLEPVIWLRRILKERLSNTFII